MWRLSPTPVGEALALRGEMVDVQTETRWTALMEDLRRRLRNGQYQHWFAQLAPVEVTPQRVVLLVPNQFYRDWIATRYEGELKAASQAATGGEPVVELRIAPQRASAPSSAETDPVAAPRLNAEYTFENFVVGPSNRLAHAASLAVAEAPGVAYNPLFMHGPVGLGKTHLLQAICHALLAAYPSLRIVYLSSESFVNEFISALQHAALEGFRDRYRTADVLVLDDVQFFTRAEQTQEEFFHTFNTLYDGQKQVIVSSDRPPGEMQGLEERLISRFKWGLVARIDPPTLETRTAILRAKANIRGAQLPDDVVHYIATHIVTNIRELEGATIKVIGYAGLTNRPIDLALTAEALQDSLAAAGPVRIEDIQRAVVRRFGVRLSDLQSKRRTKSIAYPRQVCMYLARQLTGHSLEEIGGYFGGRDHTTVLYAAEKIQKQRETDPDVDRTLQDIEVNLKGRSNSTPVA
jgi:chromosomal replication initiator protein